VKNRGSISSFGVFNGGGASEMLSSRNSSLNGSTGSIVGGCIKYHPMGSTYICCSNCRLKHQVLPPEIRVSTEIPSQLSVNMEASHWIMALYELVSAASEDQEIGGTSEIS
jgi:hypothetical protein